MGKNRTRGLIADGVGLKLGAIVWIFSIQSFLTQWWVASEWPKPYSPRNNFISDLGATSCGILPGNIQHAARYVCSPEHHWMNVSFVLSGITIGIGAILLRARLMPGVLGFMATSFFVTSGLGIMMVGLNPENMQIVRHILGAYLNAYGASFALIVMGISLKKQGKHGRLGSFTLGFGILSFFFNVMYTIGFYYNLPAFSLGLGDGGMEKLCNYSIGVMLILIGVYVIVQRVSHTSSTFEV